jgi:hypothetical protein
MRAGCLLLLRTVCGTAFILTWLLAASLAATLTATLALSTTAAFATFAATTAHA